MPEMMLGSPPQLDHCLEWPFPSHSQIGQISVMKLQSDRKGKPNAPVPIIIAMAEGYDVSVVGASAARTFRSHGFQTSVKRQRDAKGRASWDRPLTQCYETPPPGSADTERKKKLRFRMQNRR